MSLSLFRPLSLAALGLLCAAAPARAQLVGGWNFNNQSLAPEHGAGTLTATGLGATTFLPLGSSQNLVPGDAAGDALVFAITNLDNGGSLLLQTSTLGREAPVLSYAIGSTVEGFGSIAWAWSTDGATYTNFGGAEAVPTFLDTTQISQMQVHTIDFSGVDGLGQQESVYLRGTFGGATAALGSASLIMDNMQVSAAAIPEPATVGAAIGALALGFTVWRRRRHGPGRRRAMGAVAGGLVLWSLVAPATDASAQEAAGDLQIEAAHRRTLRAGSPFLLEHALVNTGRLPARFDLAIVAAGTAGQQVPDLQLLLRDPAGAWQPLSGLSHTTAELPPGGRLEFALAGTAPANRRRLAALELLIEAAVSGRPATRVTASNWLQVLPVPQPGLTTMAMPLEVTVVSRSN